MNYNILLLFLLLICIFIFIISNTGIASPIPVLENIKKLFTGGNDDENYDDEYDDSYPIFTLTSLKLHKYYENVPDENWWEVDWNTLKKTSKYKNSYCKDLSLLFERKYNFSKLIPNLQKYIDSDREWCGIIIPDRTNGEYKIISLTPSDVENIDLDDIHSKDSKFVGMITGKLVDKVGKTPGLIFFHTHPPYHDLDSIPSLVDLNAMIYNSLGGKHMVEMVFSLNGACMYFPCPMFFNYIHSFNYYRDKVNALDYIRNIIGALIVGGEILLGDITLTDYLKLFARCGFNIIHFPYGDKIKEIYKYKYTIIPSFLDEVRKMEEHSNKRGKEFLSFMY